MASRAWAPGLLSLCIAAAAAASDRGTQLPDTVSQGDLVVGTTAPGATVRYGGRVLRVDADGRFVFGVGRDETGPLAIDIAWPDGATERVNLPVATRDWRVERIEGVPQSTVTPSPAIAARIAREQAEVVAARERDDARSDFAHGFAWPVKGRVSGVYGSQRVYNGTPKSTHSGLDVAVPQGTPIHAPAAGVVTFAAPDLYLTGVPCGAATSSPECGDFGVPL